MIERKGDIIRTLRERYNQRNLEIGRGERMYVPYLKIVYQLNFLRLLPYVACDLVYI